MRFPYRVSFLAASLVGATLFPPPVLFSSAIAAAPPTLKGRNDLAFPGETWKLAWNDEFEGKSLDAAKWSIGLSWTGDDGTNRHHNDQYASYIMDEDVAVSDGSLKLFTRRGPFRNPGGKVYDYSEGLIQTDGKYETTYGYFETRVRIPVEAGPGMWPAFWMLPEGWPPEMDIMEVWTSSNRNHQGLAYRKEDGSVGWDDTNSTAPLPTGWHTFGMEWGPGYQVYNIDGRINKRIYGKHVPDVPMYIILNSGIESGWKPNASTVFPNACEFDYVRVYQRPVTPTVHDGGFENTGLEPWKPTGRVLPVGYGARTGKQALRVDAAGSTAEQVVYGLKPNTRYALTGWARVTGDGDEARIGVKDHGGPEAFESVGSRDYTSRAVSFTTGPEARSAVVYCYKPAGDGSAFFDDVTVREQ